MEEGTGKAEGTTYTETQVPCWATDQPLSSCVALAPAFVVYPIPLYPRSSGIYKNKKGQALWPSSCLTTPPPLLPPPHPRSRSIGASVSVFPGSSLTLLLSNFFNVYQSYGFNWHWCGLLVRLNTFPHGHCDLKFHSYELLVHSFPPVFYCLSFANYYICCKYFSLFYLLLCFFFFLTQFGTFYQEDFFNLVIFIFQLKQG